MEHVLYAEIYLICCIVVGQLLFWMIRRETNSTPEKKLRSLLACFLCNFFANFIFVLCNSFMGGSVLRMPLSYLFKNLYFATLVMGVGMWCTYAEAVQRTPRDRYRATMRVVGPLLALGLAPLIVNLWTGSMFSFDGDGAYRRGDGFHYFMLYLFLVSLGFAIRLLAHAAKESEPNQRLALRQTAMFPACLLLAWALCFIGESVPVICVCIMAELLFMYIGANNQLISRDKLTQVNNRQNLMSFLNHKVQFHEERLYLLMVDIDYFKNINDTYGHLEGDQALLDVVKALKQACSPFRKRPFIARYGGDEFIVVLEGGAKEVAALRESISRLLKENARPDAPYTLGVSIGMAEYDPGMSADDMIGAADKQLYEIKRSRR